MKKMLLLYNPKAGDGRIKASLSELCDFFTKNDFEVTVYPTQAPADAVQQIEARAHAYERIVVCGGDGIMHEALNGIMNADTACLLGYIPAGTVNDFANTHHISRDIMEAAKTAALGKEEQMDVGCFNGEFFSYVAAFGVATSVSYETPHQEKKRLGSLAYVLRALGAVDFAHWENNCQHMTISWPDAQASGDFLYGMVSNSKFVAGTDLFTRDLFDWKDGLLEGLFIRRPMNLAELNTIISGLVRSDFSSPMFVRAQAPWFSFEGDETAWTLDGEYGGSHDQVHINVRPLALRMLLPDEEQIREEREGGVSHGVFSRR